MTARFLVGDVFEVLATIPDGSIDAIVTSPPFLALRSYLPADHPDKDKEIGSEPTPAAFLDTMLDLTAEWRRVVAPHGSICVELGDTYSGSGGAGGDYGPGGMREGQQRFRQHNLYAGSNKDGGFNGGGKQGEPVPVTGGRGWPLDKSLCGIPSLYANSLAYGRNLLNPDHTIDPWRVRNLIAWCLDSDTPVYVRTPTGDRPMRLLHLHQQFAPGKYELWDGQRWTPVLGTSTSAADDAIEIEFRNGERIACTREHEWPTARGVLSAASLMVGDVVPTVRLPEPVAPRRPSMVPDDLGWLVGLFLADGSFDGRDRIQIAQHADAETDAARLRQIAADYDGTAGTYRYDGNEAVTVLRSKVLAGIIRRYVSGDNARNKHLDPACWGRTDDFLRAVLDGYLTGDGHYDAKNDRWRLGFTDNPWLARDLRTLGARLGITVRLARRKKWADPEHHVQGEPFCFRGEVRFGYKTSKHSRPTEPGEIVAIRASKRRTFIDVGVEGQPHLFALASGLLTHNCRPNPPVGALGDKVRPATSYVTVACTSRTRYFDLDAERQAYSANSHPRTAKGVGPQQRTAKTSPDSNYGTLPDLNNDGAGAPLLDWWEIPTQPYKGSHYATFPAELPRRLINLMVPAKVCVECGEPSRRITRTSDAYADHLAEKEGRTLAPIGERLNRIDGGRMNAEVLTLGWTDCGHDAWRPGVVLDPFAGSGTTLAVAVGLGRNAIGIDLDERNAALAEQRCGMFLEVVDR